MPVSKVMRREVVTFQPDSPLTEVVELLLDKDFTAVPVVDGAGKVVGMVSDNDLLTRGGMNVTISLKRATDAESLPTSTSRCRVRNVKSPR